MFEAVLQQMIQKALSGPSPRSYGIASLISQTGCLQQIIQSLTSLFAGRAESCIKLRTLRAKRSI